MRWHVAMLVIGSWFLLAGDLNACCTPDGAAQTHVAIRLVRRDQLAAVGVEPGMVDVAALLV